MKLIKRFRNWKESRKPIDLEQIRLIHGRCENEDM